MIVLRVGAGCGPPEGLGGEQLRNVESAMLPSAPARPPGGALVYGGGVVPIMRDLGVFMVAEGSWP